MSLLDAGRAPLTGPGSPTGRAALSGRASLTGRAVERLRRWPSLRLGPVDGGIEAGIASGGRAILYLGQGDQARLHLTWPVTMRLRDALAGCDQVTIDPDEDWIGVRLDTDGDVDFLLSLVSVAIKAHTP